MTDKVLWSAIRLKSVTAAAVLGAIADVLSIMLTFHRDALTTHDFNNGFYAAVGLGVLVGIPLLIPSLALFVFRRSPPVVVLLTTVLLLVLTMNIDQLIRYREIGVFALFPKWDAPGIALLFLSMFSAAMILVRAIIRLIDRLQGYDPDTSAS